MRSLQKQSAKKSLRSYLTSFVQAALQMIFETSYWFIKAAHYLGIRCYLLSRNDNNLLNFHAIILLIVWGWIERSKDSSLAAARFASFFFEADNTGFALNLNGKIKAMLNKTYFN